MRDEIGEDGATHPDPVDEEVRRRAARCRAPFGDKRHSRGGELRDLSVSHLLQVCFGGTLDRLVEGAHLLGRDVIACGGLVDE